MGYSWRITGYYWIYLELFEYLWHVHSLSQFFGGHQFIYGSRVSSNTSSWGKVIINIDRFGVPKFWDNPKRKCKLNLNWDSMKCMQIISNKYWIVLMLDLHSCWLQPSPTYLVIVNSRSPSKIIKPKDGDTIDTLWLFNIAMEHPL